MLTSEEQGLQEEGAGTALKWVSTGATTASAH